ncbi:MAG: hypothetical protein ACREMY_04990 [bacterium]
MFSIAKERVISGYLPLTHKSARLLALVTWVPAMAIVAGAILAAVGAVTTISSLSSAVGGILLLAGLVLVVGGGIVMLLTRPFIGPQGRVIRTGSLVELSRVSPAFVSAVKAMQDAN